MPDWFQIYVPATPARYHVLRMESVEQDLQALGAPALLSSLAHALCGLRRYGGHTLRPYTVGAHSAALALYRVRLGFERAKGDPSGVVLDGVCAAEALCALLHDAAEGFGLGDIVAPVKRAVGGPDVDAYEDAVVRASLAAVCPFFDPRRRPEQAEAVRAHLLRAMERVKRWDARILLDEFAAVVRHAERPWDSVQGLFPLCLPQGAFAALTQLPQPAAELLFVALGFALARTIKAAATHANNTDGPFVPINDDDAQPFFQALEQSLEEARFTLSHATRADAGLALLLARAMITDRASRPDVQPCRIGPREYFRLAHPHAATLWATHLAQSSSATYNDAGALAYAAERMGFASEVHYTDEADNYRARVIVQSGKTSRTFEPAAPQGWRVVAQEPPPSHKLARDMVNEALAVLPDPHRQFDEQARLLRFANDLPELRGEPASAAAAWLAPYLPNVRAPYRDRLQIGDFVLTGSPDEPWSLGRITDPLAVAEAVLGYELVDELLGYLNP